jgi:hypothetical protein
VLPSSRPHVQSIERLIGRVAGALSLVKAINRYSISARQNLRANADGSVDLHIQNESLGADRESNWPPAPKGKFILMMRLYWPSETPPSIINGSWSPPAAKRVS